MKLSVAMIVKNEETCIAKCLRSVRDADEIVIVDTGSTDKTEEVVLALKMANVRFVKNAYEWKDDFADARNFAISECSGDWALIIDADDRMEHDAIFDIREAIEAAGERRTLNVKITFEKALGFSYVYPKLIKLRSGVVFVGADHEVPNVSEGNDPVATMILGRSENHDKDPDRSLRIGLKMLEAEPENSRTLYYVAREYWYRKDYENAGRLFENCVRSSKFLAERADAYLYLARIYWSLNEGDAARDACMNAIVINANFREALCFMSEMSFEHNAIRWREFAHLANNEKVLFVRPCECKVVREKM